MAGSPTDDRITLALQPEPKFLPVDFLPKGDRFFEKMKIIFLCGCLQEGHDGVGDYVLQLCRELKNRGIAASAIAFNDYYVEREIVHREFENSGLPLIRIPAQWSGSKRQKYANDWINRFDPEWISLQFVPYAYQQKGLPMLLPQQLSGLVGKRKLHIMFHELWVNYSRRNIISGGAVPYLQKLIIRTLFSICRPCLTHTHLPQYHERLSNIPHAIVRPLPLFSNIPVVHSEQVEEDKDTFRIGAFSRVEIGPSIINFLGSVHQMIPKESKSIELLLIGAIDKMRGLAEALGANEYLRIRYTGFLEAEKVSRQLKACQLGITSVPRHALGKSGSVAAFIAHGIPVAAPLVSGRWSPDNVGFFSKRVASSILLTNRQEEYLRAKTTVAMAGEEISVATVTDTFLCDLNKS